MVVSLSISGARRPGNSCRGELKYTVGGGRARDHQERAGRLRQRARPNAREIFVQPLAATFEGECVTRYLIAPEQSRFETLVVRTPLAAGHRGGVDDHDRRRAPV